MTFTQDDAAHAIGQEIEAHRGWVSHSLSFYTDAFPQQGTEYAQRLRLFWEQEGQILLERKAAATKKTKASKRTRPAAGPSAKSREPSSFLDPYYFYY